MSRKKSRTAAAPAARPPVAHSYLRFSTPEQEWGDSTRRQAADSESWSVRAGVPLSDLGLADKGKSAFHGRHRDEKAALGRFLELAKKGDGQVQRGDYLVIENLDRLSREEEVPATHLLTSILMAGVRVVQLAPYEMELTDKSDGWTIMRAVMELSRGHGESKVKSERCAKVWHNHVREARNGTLGGAVTARLPAWLRVVGRKKNDRGKVIDRGTVVEVPERVAVLKRMFAMAASGYGCGAISKTFTEENVPPFSNRHKGKDGKTAEGGRWNRMYVRSVLLDRRALGEWQPRTPDGRPEGDPIEGYFPQIVTEAEFDRVKAAVFSRTQRQGRVGTGVACVFGGLLHDATDPQGGNYQVGTRVTRDRKDPLRRRSRHVLVNSAYAAGRGDCVSFPLETFERALLTLLREVPVADVVGTAETGPDRQLEAELADARAKRASLRAVMEQAPSLTTGELLRQAEARESDLTAQLNKAREAVAAPPEESWRAAQTLIDLLDSAEDREDVRLRLRAQIRRRVEGVWLVVANRGRDRLCAIQVFFVGGNWRSVLIWHRPPSNNGRARRPGFWKARSMTSKETEGHGLTLLPGATDDLRQRAGAAEVAEYLAELTEAELEGPVFGRFPAHPIT
jgi:DNA invertase Pin-like site-specific DNA recombinase